MEENLLDYESGDWNADWDLEHRNDQACLACQGVKNGGQGWIEWTGSRSSPRAWYRMISAMSCCLGPGGRVVAVNFHCRN